MLATPFGYLLAILATEALASASCEGDRPLSLCCMGLAPFSTNAYVWGNICGHTPSSQSELIGGRCTYLPSGTCPSGAIPACCAGTWPGPSGQCALGTNCETMTTGIASATVMSIPATSASSTPTPTPSFIAAPVPDGWAESSSCAQDDGSRVIYNDVITQLTDNTPATCIAHCAASGYTFAGVEHGNECHCGNGFLPGTPDDIAQSECCVPCAGDSRYSCGGSWAIQLYTGPTPTEALPDGWSLVRYCGVDEANRIIENDGTSVLSDNTPETCIKHCIGLGFAYAGVEYGDECHCGTGYTGSAQAPTADCDMPCAGNPGITCGGSWRIQIYSSEPQQT